MIRKDLYSQKFKIKPTKPNYLLNSDTRIAVLKILGKYCEYNITEDGWFTGKDSIELCLRDDFLENYRWEKLPKVTLWNGKKQEATMEIFLRYEFLSNKTQFLDAVQIFVDYATNKKLYVKEINNLFEIDNFGYRIINDEIVKIGSQETFKQTEEAFRAIDNIELDNAKKELQESMRYYYSGDKPLAIKKALDSVDTVLKYLIIKDDKIIDKEINDRKGQTKNLIERVNGAGYFNSFGDIPLHIGIEHVLGPLRNKIPGAGHSRGLTKIEIDDEVVEFAVGLASSYIIFLIKRFLKRQM